MNEEHLTLLRSDEWRDTLRDLMFPFAFGDGSPDDLGTDVLEVGPGPGLTTDLLTRSVAHLTAIELDPTLASPLAERTDPERVTVVEGDASAMPFEDGRFTGAVSFTMLHHVPDVATQDRLFAEVARVLHPGGLFVAADASASEDLEALHDDDVYNPVDPSTLEARLRSAGFTDVDLSVAEGLAWSVRARVPA